jgi:hypothetical protein
VRDEIRDPDRPTRSQRAMKLGEHREPFLVSPEMVQHRRRDDDVEFPLLQLDSLARPPLPAVARTCGAAAATRCAARSSIGRLKSTSVTPRSDGIRPISFSE